MEILQWNIENETISFGEKIPFSGNRYKLVVIGIPADEQTNLEFNIVDNSGEKILARSEVVGDHLEIGLRSVSLRNEFVKAPHEMRSFHVYVHRGSETIAHGDLFIQWTPLFKDDATTPAYTIKGDKGDTGSTGATGADGMSAYQVAVESGFRGTKEEWLKSLIGPVNPLLAVQDAQGKWHNVSAVPDSTGTRTTLDVDENGTDNPANVDTYVTTGTDQTVTGDKTFSTPVLCLTVNPPDETSGYLATVPWVVGKIDSKLTAFKGANQTFTGDLTVGKITIGGTATCTTPTEDTHVANKGYVDSCDQQLDSSITNLATIMNSFGMDSMYFTKSNEWMSGNIPVVPNAKYEIHFLYYCSNTSGKIYLQVFTVDDINNPAKEGSKTGITGLYTGNFKGIQAVTNNIMVRIKVSSTSYIKSCVIILRRVE